MDAKNSSVFTDSELEELNKKIRFIKGEYYVRRFEIQEIKSKNLDDLDFQEDLLEKVNFSNLAKMQDMMCYTSFAYPEIFYPKEEEILGQIPKELLPGVIAIQVITGAKNIYTTCKSATREGLHVAIIRLYKKYTIYDGDSAKAIKTYPEDKFELPIGMTVQFFKKLFS